MILYNYRSNRIEEQYSLFNTPYENPNFKSGFLHSGFPLNLLQDRSGTLWVGHNEGLDKFDQSSNSFTQIDFSSLSCPFYVYKIIEPSNNDDYLWLATPECGLFFIP